MLRENTLRIRLPYWGPMLEVDGMVALLSLAAGLVALWMFLTW